MGYGVGLVARAPPSAQLLIRSAAMPLEERRVTAWLLATRVRGEKRPIPILRTAFPEELVQCTSNCIREEEREVYLANPQYHPFFSFYPLPPPLFRVFALRLLVPPIVSPISPFLSPPFPLFLHFFRLFVR